jgi:hypothetical protein
MDEMTNPCPICDGWGYLECDDGSEILCEHCDGTGSAPTDAAVEKATALA